MLTVNCRRDPAWLELGLAALEYEGAFVVEDVVEPAMLAEARERMYDVQARIRADVGDERLARAGELGVLRLMLAYDEWFVRFLELPELLAIVDATVSPTAVLHLQNGFVLPPTPPANGTQAVFQQRVHRDFPRHMEGYLASLPFLVANLAAAPYFDFVTTMFLAFGLVLEFPIVLYGLSRVGIATSARLAASRRVVLLVIAVVAAVATPGGDIVSMLVLGGTMYILFELTVFAIRRTGR